MYATCPKCGHTPGEVDAGQTARCPACGLIFSKWMKQRFRPEEPLIRDDVEVAGDRWQRLTEHLLYVEPKVNVIFFGGRCLVLAGLVAWSIWFFQTDYRELYGHLPEINESFMHLVNLAFHEAGHILFGVLGDFMGVLGGSLMQLLVPGAVMVTFVLKHRNTFGGAVGLWWLGQSAMDLAPYINDARAGQLVLLGGVLGRERPGYHDWSNLLGRLDLLTWDHALGALVNFLGMGLMLLALVWGGYILRVQYRNLDRRF
jgi:hypothetical protein